VTVRVFGGMNSSKIRNWVAGAGALYQFVAINVEGELNRKSERLAIPR